MSADPVKCSVEGCSGRPLYKMADKGYCQRHRPNGNWRDEIAVVARVVAADGDVIALEPVVNEDLESN